MYKLTYKTISLTFKRYNDFYRICNRLTSELPKAILFDIKDLEHLKDNYKVLGLPGFNYYTVNNGVFRFAGGDLVEVNQLPEDICSLQIGVVSMNVDITQIELNPNAILEFNTELTKIVKTDDVVMGDVFGDKEVPSFIKEVKGKGKNAKNK
jgi:hypothetical protein